jgi:pimeloyl-ACP methyl ester carboxylesterase
MKEATMDTSRTHTFTIGRIVALVLIGLMLAGLAFLRFASNDDPVSVPDGAEAGDLELSACDFESENGLLDADCGTLVVAENGTDPESRLIALPVIRIRAGSDDPGEAIFRLNGGPGQSNMDFPQAARYSGNHDVVMVGYRGADGSVRLDCPEVEAALQRSPDFLAEESLLAYGDAFRSCADRLGGEGTDLSSYGLVQQADDIEAARVALGYDRINLLGESAGTRTAMIYAWRYPESIHRSVMFGVNPPGHLVYDPETTDEQIGRYAELCS